MLGGKTVIAAAHLNLSQCCLWFPGGLVQCAAPMPFFHPHILKLSTPSTASTAITTLPWVTTIQFRLTEAFFFYPSRTTKRTYCHQLISLIPTTASSTHIHTHTNPEPTASHSPVTTSTWPLLNVLRWHTTTHSHKQPPGLAPAAATHSLPLPVSLCLKPSRWGLLRTTSDRNLEQRK